MARKDMLHVVEVKDVTVYPVFCFIADKQRIYNLPGICEDDDGSIAWLTREDRERYMVNARMQRYRSNGLTPAERKRRQRELHRRRCQK